MAAQIKFNRQLVVERALICSHIISNDIGWYIRQFYIILMRNKYVKQKIAAIPTLLLSGVKIYVNVNMAATRKLRHHMFVSLIDYGFSLTHSEFCVEDEDIIRVNLFCNNYNVDYLYSIKLEDCWCEDSNLDGRARILKTKRIDIFMEFLTILRNCNFYIYVVIQRGEESIEEYF